MSPKARDNAASHTPPCDVCRMNSAVSPLNSLKYRLSVCPHDTAKNLAGWFLINTYLQRQLNLSMRFEPCENFNTEREQVLAGGYHVVYANPYSALQYWRERHFIPVARPAGVFDETLLVARHNHPADLSQVSTAAPLKVASATDKLIVHFLGLTLLNQLGVAMTDCQFEMVGNHLKAVHAVRDGRADVGFVFNETWQGLSDTSRSSLKVLAATQSHMASHCFCISPELAPRHAEIQAVLCGMGQDPAGRKILDDLRFQGFEPMATHELEALQHVISPRSV